MRNQKALGAGVLLAVVAVFAIGSQVVPLSTDTCIGNYEDAGAAGDSMVVCAIPATAVAVSNLGTHTEGLHSGCNRGVNQSSTWSDCISSAKVTNLPAGTKALWYQDTSYGSVVKCYDTDGNSGVIDMSGGANDVISSFRILGGNC